MSKGAYKGKGRPRGYKVHSIKHHPYRLWCLLVFGSHSWVTWDGLMFTADRASLCRVFQVPQSRIKEYMEYLVKHNMVTEVTYPWSKIQAKVVVPQNLAVNQSLQNLQNSQQFQIQKDQSVVEDVDKKTAQQDVEMDKQKQQSTVQQSQPQSPAPGVCCPSNQISFVFPGQLRKTEK